MRVIRVYADTSVFGGCFDKGFEQASRRFFDEVPQGRFRLVVSAATVEELREAPEYVRALLDEIPTGQLEYHEITEEMVELRDAYLKAGILGETSDADALHVAAATVLNCDIVLSWNFKHIVHFEKIQGFNAVNRMNNYKAIDIYSPPEVVEL